MNYIDASSDIELSSWSRSYSSEEQNLLHGRVAMSSRGLSKLTFEISRKTGLRHWLAALAKRLNPVLASVSAMPILPRHSTKWVLCSLSRCCVTSQAGCRHFLTRQTQ